MQLDIEQMYQSFGAGIWLLSPTVTRHLPLLSTSLPFPWCCPRESWIPSSETASETLVKKFFEIYLFVGNRCFEAQVFRKRSSGARMGDQVHDSIFSSP